MVIPLVTTEPTFEDIMNTQKLLYTNFISIASLIGGGHYGHLGPAVDPGPIAQVAIGTEDVEAASLVCLHDEFKRIRITHLNCDEACNKLMVASCDNMYTEALQYYLLGYANFTPLDLLVYLRLTYGRIERTQLADFYNNMITLYALKRCFHKLMLVCAKQILVASHVQKPSMSTFFSFWFW
jgi:hypothetical protein